MLTWYHATVLPIAPLSPPSLLDIISFCLGTLQEINGDRDRDVDRDRGRQGERVRYREGEERGINTYMDGWMDTEIE